MLAEAVTAVMFTFEWLEYVHLLRVGHETCKDGFEAGVYLKSAAQKKIQNLQDEKDPAGARIRDAKTLYDFESNADPALAKQQINAYAQTYLEELNKSLGMLYQAKDYFNKTYNHLQKLVNAATLEDTKKCKTHLRNLKFNFRRFNEQLKQFSAFITPPQRKKLYIAHQLNEEGKDVIGRFNEDSVSIKTCYNELKATQLEITHLVENYLNTMSTTFANANPSAVLSFAELKQAVRGSLDDPKLIPKTMQSFLSEHKPLADICIDIARIATEMKLTARRETPPNDSWEDNVYWFPLLLTEEKQIEKGQLIFLHLMNQEDLDTKSQLLRKTKTCLAEIFLIKQGCKPAIDKITTDRWSQELASALIVEQRKKCKHLMEFLEEQIQGESVSARELNPDELLLYHWLETNRKNQTSVELFQEILVSPYLLSGYHIESLAPKLKELLPYENTDELIKAYRASHWGVIREKSDCLIQLPDSFKTIIRPNERFQCEDPSKGVNLVCTVRSELCKKLKSELEIINTQLHVQKEDLDEKITNVREEAKKAGEQQKNLAHKQGVERIKKAHRYLPSIDHKSNVLYPCLYHAETINEVEKALQVPTLDDLQQIIHKGVDLHAVYKGAANVNSNRLRDYFYPIHAEDSKMGAYLYAVNECGMSSQPLLSLLSCPVPRLLAIGNGDNKTLSLMIILKNANKSAVLHDSLVLNNIASKTIEETETFRAKLGQYGSIALARFRPELRHALSYSEKCKLFIQNLLNLGEEIRTERFESVVMIQGKYRLYLRPRL